MEYTVKIFHRAESAQDYLPYFWCPYGKSSARELANKEELSFDSKDDLYAWVASYNKSSKRGELKNPILSAIMCNPNDKLNLSKMLYVGVVEGRDVFCSFLVKKRDGKTIDLRLYANEILDFDSRSLGERSLPRHSTKWAAQEERYAKWRRLVEGKPYWRYYRHTQTIQEKRFACDSEHKPFIRGSRSASNLPSSYDDLYFYREKTWKARTKAKRQWQVNLKSHVDTVHRNQKEYDEGLLCEE